MPGMPVTEQPVRSAFDDRSSRAASPRLSSNCICCGMSGSVIGVMSVCHVHRTAPVPLFMGQPPYTRAIDRKVQANHRITASAGWLLSRYQARTGSTSQGPKVR